MRIVNCSEIGDQVRGLSYKKGDVKEEPFEDSIPVLRAGNINDETGCIKFENLYHINKVSVNQSQLMQTGDILIAASSGSIDVVGKAACYSDKQPSTFGAFCKVIRPNKDKVDSKYLFYFFRSSGYRRKIKELAQGANINNIRNEHLDNLKIPLPSLEEQKSIVAKLDRAQRLINIDKAMLEKYEQLIQSVFLDMFGDPVTNPKGWEVKKLEDLTTAIGSGTTPKGGKKVYVEQGILFLRSQNVWRNKLELDDVAYIDQQTHESMIKSSLKNGDILMTKTGRFNTANSSLGRAALYTGKDDRANLNGHVYLIRLKDGLNIEFVLYILITDQYRDYIRRVCVGGIDKRQINKTHLEEFPIIFPPLDQQNEFTDTLKSIECEKAKIENSLKKSQELFSTLVQEVFG